MNLGDAITLGGLAGLGIMTIRWAMGRNGEEREAEPDRGYTQTQSFAIPRIPSSADDGGYSIAKTPSSANDLTRTLKRKINESSIEVLGFDCEYITYPPPRQKVSLLQIATPDGFCALFRVKKLGGVLPLELKKLLEDKAILKVGVDVINDVQKLNDDYGISVKGCLDLRYLAEIANAKGRGIGSLIQELVGSNAEKKQKNKHGNWDEEVLSEGQIKYACKDVRNSYIIFEKLKKSVPRDEWWSFIDEPYRAQGEYRYFYSGPSATTSGITFQ